jgi:predicted O-methyltransferase YrrM
MKYTASLVNLKIDERVAALRADALSRGIPVADDETLNYLLLIITAFQPKRILEIGTAVGLSASAMLMACPDAKVTTMELEEERYIEAKENFKKLGVEKRVNAYLGDAGEILAMMDGQFDFVFLDGPKAQYEKYLFDLKRLMRKGAILFADDVLLYGWVSGEEPTPQKRHSIVDKIRSYLNVVTNDEAFMTSVLNVGDGVALSVYLGEEKND